MIPVSLMMVVAMTVAAAIVDAQHAVHAADHAPDTGAHCAADNAADRTCRAIAPIGAFCCAARHAVKDTLCMSSRRDGKERQSSRDQHQIPATRSGDQNSFSLHCEVSVRVMFGVFYNTVSQRKLRQL